MTTDLALPDTVQEFMKAFRDNGYEIFVVGGSVRDMLREAPVKDWDFTTSAKPDEIQKIYPDSKYENTFGTVLVNPSSREKVQPSQGPTPSTSQASQQVFEVTPFRKEGRYSDNRHPDEIEWADSIEEDVKRRDFTVNALAYDGEKLVDLVDGQKDLEDRIIRAVGNPEKRFEEDALRMLRAVRFAAQLGFHIEPKTLEAIQKHAQTIKNVSWERISDEFLRILASDNAADAIMLLKNSGLLIEIMPELHRCFAIEQESPERHHTDDVGTHLVKTLKHCPSPDPIVRFAALIHDIGKAETREVGDDGVVTFYNHEIVGANIAHNIAKRFRLSKKNKIRLVTLVRYHMFSVQETQTDKAVRRFIRRVGKENIQDMLDLRTGDRIGSGVPETSWRTELFKKRIIEVQKRPFEIRDLKISGDDVMKELNLKPGPEVGKYLKQLFDEVVDSGLENKKDILMKRLKEIAGTA